jgi:uncharacterized protein YndB with AHSA1/START domain
VDPPSTLVNTERWRELAQTLNTLVLEERRGETRATLTLLYPDRDARDAALDTGMAAGLERSFERLDAYLSGPDGVGIRRRAGPEHVAERSPATGGSGSLP